MNNEEVWKARTCRHCGSTKLILIVYGLLSPKDTERIKRGEYKFGGNKEKDKYWYCKNCKAELNRDEVIFEKLISYKQVEEIYKEMIIKAPMDSLKFVSYIPKEPIKPGAKWVELFILHKGEVPFELLSEIKENDFDGLYEFSSANTGEILYVGESGYVLERISSHGSFLVGLVDVEKSPILVRVRRDIYFGERKTKELIKIRRQKPKYNVTGRW